MTLAFRPTCLALALLAALAAVPAQAQSPTFPEGMEHVFRLRSMPQYHSNPARLPDNDTRRQGSQVLINTIGGAVRMPLLSERTRLELAGNIGDARYDGNRQLDHQPKQFSAALPWRAGKLFAGRFSYGYSDRLYEYLNRTWPDRDMQAQQRWQSQLGLRVTEDLTLPLLSVYQGRSRYETDLNRTLYNRDETGWEASAYYSGMDRSFVNAGFRQSRVNYIDRTDFWRAQIDDAYQDNEIFIDSHWDLTIKTSVETRFGYLRRSYENLGERDTSLITIDTRASYQYSPKTRFEVYGWRRPYSNDDSPDTIYSTQTGLRMTMRWQASDRSAAWLSVAREVQADTRFSGVDSRSTVWRYGTRLEWKATDNVRMVLDGYRTREVGADAGNSFSQNIVRLGVEFSTSRGSSQPERMLFTSECDWRYVEYLLCDAIRPE